MDLSELKRKRAGVYGSMKQIVDKAKAEKRGITDEERTTYDRLDRELSEIDDQVREAELVLAANRSNGPGLNDRRGTDQVRVADLPEETIARFGEHMAALSQSRAIQSEGVNADGGFAVPTPMANTIIDLVRNAMVTRQAGVQVFNLDSQTHRLPKLEKDAKPTWRAENAPIGEDSIVIGSNTFRARTAAVIVRASLEVVEDAPLLGSTVLHSLQQAAALELDRVTLAGSGVGEEPTGILNTVGVTKVAHGTGAFTYDTMAAEVAAIRAANYTPSAQVYGATAENTVGTLKGSDGHYLQPPSYLANVPRLPSGQAGTALYTGDFSQVILGLRNTIKVVPLRERYVDLGQTAWLLWFRGDVQVVRTAAVRVRTGVVA